MGNKVNKDWTGNRKSTYITLGASNHTDKEREVRDFYATDPIAIDKLLSCPPTLHCQRRFGSALAVRDICLSGWNSWGMKW